MKLLGFLVIIVAGVLLFVLLGIGLAAILLLGSLGGYDTSQLTATYEDETVSARFPGWEEGGVLGTNDFFTVNLDEGRSYALNYYNYEDDIRVINDERESVCMAYSDECYVINRFSFSGQNTNFDVLCKEDVDENLGGVEKCFATTQCGDSVIVISVVQERDSSATQAHETRSIPMDEYKAILFTARCK
ncbi:MAG: hypothetical protein JW834_04175 [Candidatus Diapherotrites archaeon]|nr:hypothetical protein [Candidatus Diapherotrites archaeon]